MRCVCASEWAARAHAVPFYHITSHNTYSTHTCIAHHRAVVCLYFCSHFNCCCQLFICAVWTIWCVVVIVAQTKCTRTAAQKRRSRVLAQAWVLPHIVCVCVSFWVGCFGKIKWNQIVLIRWSVARYDLFTLKPLYSSIRTNSSLFRKPLSTHRLQMCVCVLHVAVLRVAMANDALRTDTISVLCRFCKNYIKIGWIFTIYARN